MIINNLKLPDTFVEVILSGRLRRKIGVWELKRERDSYGNEFEGDLAEFFGTLERLQAETDALRNDFIPNEYYGKSQPEFMWPGSIPDIIDFSLVVACAQSSDGSPYCFDFRDDLHRPSVVWWADACWHRVSPDFTAFLDLFDLEEVGR